jgi:hypothetical protein
VAAVDVHEKNRPVAFWRDAIQEDWKGLPGYDRRVAAIVPFPYATSAGDGFTVENSQPAWNRDIVIAQYAGFDPKCDAPRGVQKLDWIEPACVNDGLNIRHGHGTAAGSLRALVPLCSVAVAITAVYSSGGDQQNGISRTSRAHTMPASNLRRVSSPCCTPAATVRNDRSNRNCFIQPAYSE